LWCTSLSGFWQTVVVVVMVMFGMTISDVSTGIFLGLGGGLLEGVLSLINAGKKATSRTKISCITCKEKTIFNKVNSHLFDA
jgi:hypothetical protein